ncbi:UDP-glucuronate 4-epimerase [Phycisphaerales bacterium]|nr:UDP-glucuronate 4-epimerase [Phycisphaerales bacterium]
MTKAPILITGAAGFIGSHVAQAVVRMGGRVVGVDNLDPFYPRSCKEANLRELAASASFEFVESDIADARAMRGVFGRVRPAGVIHLAAKAGVRPSIADPVGYAHANITGTAVIQQAAAESGCDRLVVASSSSVYGNSLTAPFSETQDVNEPISPYAATKRATELIGHTHWKLTGMPTAELRFFTVYGPRQRPDLAIAKFLGAVAKGEPVTLFGDGSMSRDYTYIDDIVAGVLAAYDRIPAHGYRVWNLGGNHPVALGEMLATVERVVGKKAVVKRGPMQPGDVLRTWADLTRSSAELGYSPRTPFEEGVEKQWAWLKAER